jgi:CxxC motif-containing protein
LDDGVISSIEGNTCSRGEKYARDEVKNPVRTFTTTVKVDGGTLPVCPVRSRTPLPLLKIFDVAREAAKLNVKPPIKAGQTLIENVCGTGVDIVARRPLPKK